MQTSCSSSLNSEAVSDVVAKETQKVTILSPTNVQRVYGIVHKHSGSLGGNGRGGAIYGELTIGSMQEMTNLMIEHTGLSKSSRFIDVGCGLGKPNLHVAQYPGVEFSYGIEMEHVRWMLGMTNLNHVLEAAKKDAESDNDVEDDAKIGHSCYFSHGDITAANFFDPFTHVYMFDIGFPPRLFHQLANMFNISQSEYLICYHGPRLMIEDYGFNIELLHQTPQFMHGSAEGRQGYIYRRSKNEATKCTTKTFGVPCDPLFADAWEMCRSRNLGNSLLSHVSTEIQKYWGVNNKRVTRASRKKILKVLEEYPNLDMKPLFEWGASAEGEQTLKALPYLIDWFHTARSQAINGAQKTKLSTIFQFARAMPLLFVSSASNIKLDSKKRKRGDIN